MWHGCPGGQLGHKQWGAEWKREAGVSEGQDEQGPEAKDGEIGGGDFLCLVVNCRENEGKKSQMAVATHSSVLAWRIPGTGEPGGLTSMGSNRVGHD